MEMIARKIGTVRTKKNSFFSDAFVKVARFGHVNGLDGSLFIAASLADAFSGEIFNLWATTILIFSLSLAR
jgi:hypothetical protein